MKVDINTLILFTGICHLLQFLVFLHQLITNPKLKGTGWWLLWSIAEMFAFFLMLFRGNPIILPYIIAVQDIIILMGTLFIYFGIRTFFDKSLNLKFAIPFILTFSLAHWFFCFVFDSILFRTIILDIALSFLAFLTAYSIYKFKTPTLASSANFNISLFIIHGLIFTYRSILLIFTDINCNMLDDSLFNYSQFFDALIIGLLWTFGLIIMLNQKLNNENKELKLHFEEIFNTSPDAALITRLSDSGFVDSNDGFTLLTGYTKEEMKDRTLLEVNIYKNNSDREGLISQLKEFGYCYNFEAEFKHKSGGYFTGLMSAKLIYIQNIAHIISITKNISERKRIENELKESNEKFRDFANLLPQIVFETDIHGKLTFINKHAYQILGYPTDYEISGLNTFDLFIPEDRDRAQKNIKHTLLRGNNESSEYALIRHDGKILNMLMYSNPIIKDSIPIGLRGIMVDITKIKMVEEELKLKNLELVKLIAIKDKLFSIIGHDLRNPFTSILGFAELLETNIKSFSKEEIENMIKMIHKSSSNTFRLLDNLLSWAKTQTGQINLSIELVELNEIIKETTNLLFPQAKNKEITLSYNSTHPYLIYSDKNLIKTILRNLLTNAIKFSNRFGEVKIEIVDKDEFVEVAVSDNGVGMSIELQSTLFADILNQSRYGTDNEIGSGLGLAICKEFIQKLGGTIRVDSEIGKGSTFVFTLPKQLSKRPL